MRSHLRGTTWQNALLLLSHHWQAVHSLTGSCQESTASSLRPVVRFSSSTGIRHQSGCALLAIFTPSASDAPAALVFFHVPSLSSDSWCALFNREETRPTPPQKDGVKQACEDPSAHPGLKLCIHTDEFLSFRLITFHTSFSDSPPAPRHQKKKKKPFWCTAAR